MINNDKLQAIQIYAMRKRVLVNQYSIGWLTNHFVFDKKEPKDV